jgi:hypothetical protein
MSLCILASGATTFLALYFLPELNEVKRRRSTPSLDAPPGRAEKVPSHRKGSPSPATASSSFSLETDDDLPQQRRKAVRFELQRNIWISPEKFQEDAHHVENPSAGSGR